MFGKCIKHELRATRRTLAPILLAMLAVSLLASVLVAIEGRLLANGKAMAFSTLGGTLVGILLISLFVLAVTVGVVAFIMVIRRFYTSFFTDEGYLTFTLPVTIHEHILSKLVVSLIWQVLSGVCVLVSSGMLVLAFRWALNDEDLFMEISAAFSELFSELGAIFSENFGVAFLPLFAVYALLSMVYTICLLYFCISLACMIAKKHRVVMGILCGYGINWGFSLVGGIAAVVLFLVMAVTNVLSENVTLFFTLMMALATVLAALQVFLCYFGTKWILTKKLNLD